MKNYFENFDNNKKKIGIVGDFDHFKNSKLYKINGLDFEKFNKDKNYSLLLMWEPYEHASIPNINVKIINKNLKDISKLNLEKVHKEIFGYNLLIEPTKFDGEFISKGNGNKERAPLIPSYKLHKRKLKLGEVNKNLIYQKNVNNTDDNNNIIDHRAFVFNYKVKYVIKYVVDTKFLTRVGTTKKKEFVEFEKYFDKSDIIKINRFINKLGVEYGEIDIIRDRNTKKLYLIDVNNTPSGEFHKSGFSKNQINEVINFINKK